MNWLDRRRFTLLLVALGLLLVIYPLLRSLSEGRLLFDVLLGLVFVAAVHGVFRDQAYRWPAFVLGIPAFVGNWLDYALPESARIPFANGFHLWAALFLMYSVVVVLLIVYRAPVVSVDGVCGAFCGYLLLGLAFSHLYCVLELTAPGSFPLVQQRLRNSGDVGHLRYFLLSYFSFGALTTGGAGDLMAASDSARSLAMVETILGQFYLAGLIAELIGRRVSQAPPSAAPDGES